MTPCADTEERLILNAKVLDFCYAEVARQGWNTNTPEGEVRVLWMLKAWDWAARGGHTGADERPDFDNVNQLGKMVEKFKNENGWRRVGVRVGSHIAPPADQVSRLMFAWSQAVAEGRFTPDEAYLEFQQIHPFVDGNGRVGKIIHNWLSGTLHDPVLVKDYFGCANP
jgi:hypothetical protein